MEKKNRPLQAANSDIRVSDVTPLTKSLQAPKRTPKKHRARVYMLRTGIEGWTENDILRYCRLSSGRNYATELEYGGEGGIRTPDTLPYTHFPGVLLQPLGHLTKLSFLSCWNGR